MFNKLAPLIVVTSIFIKPFSRLSEFRFRNFTQARIHQFLSGLRLPQQQLKGPVYFLLFALLPGCSYSTFYVPVERLVYSPTSPASIAVSSQKTLRQPHKILGRVAAITWGGGDSARAAIQDEASRLGANLIIDLRLEKAFGRTAASGLAVLLLSEGNIQ
jgi:hypothetical protein